MVTVKVGGNIVAQSDDLGPVVCPDNPRASGVTVHVVSGTTYTITVAAGAAWSAGGDNAFSLDVHCNGPLESYWEAMFNNSGYDYALFSVVNGVWYYDGVSTCVGKGQYWGVCPFHHVHCSGYSTYGWGSDQTHAVLDALAQPDYKFPGYSGGCPAELTCSASQYTCVNRECVDLDRLCDGVDDCGDNSDEDRDLTRDLCGVECTAHLQCSSLEHCDSEDGGCYCNNQNECVDPCTSCNATQDAVDGVCPSCQGFCNVNGCTNPLAINYDPLADCDDGFCEICFDGTGGPSLHLVTDYPANLNAGRCGLASNGDLELSCTTSQKYPISIVSLLSPLTGEQPFSTSFNQQGRNPTTSPAYWSHAQGPVCDNTYDGVFSWSDVLKSDESTVMIRTDFAETVMFTGWIAVDMYEQLDPLRNVNLTRWVRQKLPFRIMFDTDVTAFSRILKVHHDWTTFFAIIEQKTIVVDSSASPPRIEADIVLWSSIEYPFRLTETDISVNVPELDNAGLAVSLLEDCAPATGEPCNQKWLIHVNLEDECYFTGRYSVDFDISCLPSVDSPNCPLNSSRHTTAVDFDIETENVCPTMILNVVSTGSVKSFQTPRIGTGPYIAAEHFAFMVNNWAHFEVTMDSVEGLIVETTITRIELCFDVTCVSPVLIYENGLSIIADLQLSVLDYPRNPTTSPLPHNSDIKMYLHDSIFNVPVDGNIDFYLVIDVDVEYFHTQMLLEEGQEREMTMVTAEKLRHTKRAKQLLANEPASSQSATTTVGGTVIGSQAQAGSSSTSADAAGDSPSIKQASAASTVRATVGSLAAVAIALAMW